MPSVYSFSFQLDQFPIPVHHVHVLAQAFMLRREKRSNCHGKKTAPLLSLLSVYLYYMKLVSEHALTSCYDQTEVAAAAVRGASSFCFLSLFIPELLAPTVSSTSVEAHAFFWRAILEGKTAVVGIHSTPLKP